MRAIYYNFLSGIGVSLGLVNILITWRLFGTTAHADTWLLSNSIVGALSLIALLGVEQFQYIYVDIKKDNPDHADRYARTIVIWACVWGLIYSVISACFLSELVFCFSSGLNQAMQYDLMHMICPMLLQVMAAPLLHVTRQFLNATEHFVLSYLLSVLLPFFLSVVLLMGVFHVINVLWLPQAVGLIGIMQILLCLFSLHAFLKPGPLATTPTKVIKNLFIKSASMRSAHSMHNFLSALIMSNALSSCPAGSIAIFQYAKRFVDGISGLAVGIHAEIFYSKLALYWGKKELSQLKSLIKNYLKNSLLLFVLGVFCSSLLFPHVLAFISNTPQLDIPQISAAFFMLALWRIIIILESISVGIITITHNSLILFVVNTIFILLMWAILNIGTPPLSITLLINSLIFSQLSSLILFTTSGLLLLKRKAHTQAEVTPV